MCKALVMFKDFKGTFIRSNTQKNWNTIMSFLLISRYSLNILRGFPPLITTQLTYNVQQLCDLSSFRVQPGFSLPSSHHTARPDIPFFGMQSSSTFYGDLSDVEDIHPYWLCRTYSGAYNASQENWESRTTILVLVQHIKFKYL